MKHLKHFINTQNAIADEFRKAKEARDEHNYQEYVDWQKDQADNSYLIIRLEKHLEEFEKIGGNNDEKL